MAFHFDGKSTQINEGVLRNEKKKSEQNGPGYCDVIHYFSLKNNQKTAAESGEERRANSLLNDLPEGPVVQRERRTPSMI